MKAKFLLFLLIFQFFIFSSILGQDFYSFTSFPPNVNSPKALEIYKKIAKEAPVRYEGPRATFLRNGIKWTIIGANAPIVNPTRRPKNWPVKGNKFEVLVIPEPITNYKILPWTEKIENAVRSDTISIVACPGEYEPASFVIRSGNVDLKNVMVTCSDLKYEGTDKNGRKQITTISKGNIDIRVVKCWYQAGKELWLGRGMKKTLTPELLLHDDSLIQVNYEYQVNIIKNFDHIKDADSLLPFTIPKKENKQIWITVKVPENAKSGSYSGIITIIAKNGLKKQLKLSCKVLPFKLSPPKIEYAIFYIANLNRPSQSVITESYRKSEEQMLSEFKDMKAHGIEYPVIQMRSFDPIELRKIFQLMSKASYVNDILFYTSWPKLNINLSFLKNTVNNVVKLAQKNGFKQVYFYGVDELKGKRLIAQRPILETIKKAGAKTFVTAIEFNFPSLVGDLVDIAIWHGKLNPLFAKNMHKLYHKAWSYGNPQCGKEEPETYRRNYGLALWKADYDGVCDYAYQCTMGKKIWDDFDFERYRDHVMAYPTINGVIPTIQWEGFREGVDDVRYLTSLFYKVKTKDGEKQANNKIKQFLNILDKNLSLHQIRYKIASEIVKLEINKLRR